MKAWKQVKFKNILENGSISYGIVQPGSHQNINSVPILRVNNLSQNRIDLSNVLKVAKEIEGDYLRTRLEGGELLITVVGSVGICAIAPKELKGWNVARAIAVGKIKNDYDINFIKYQFYSDDIKFQIYGNINDTVQPTLNLSSLKELSFFLPPLREQRAIAAVLSNLDDKIDLLQRQNAALEAMAEALFKQWFVAEAKEEWEEKKLSDLINLVGGGTPKTSLPSYWGGTIPWLSGGDISCHHKKFIFSSEKFITEAGLNNSAARLVPKYATIITARGTVGKFCLAGKSMSFSQTNYGVMPKDNKNFFFTFLLIDYVVNILKSAAYGSVFDTITSQLFDEVSIALPSKKVIEKFDLTVGVFFEKIFSNQKQIQTLEMLRDALLPKLMSGEVRVSLD